MKKSLFLMVLLVLSFPVLAHANGGGHSDGSQGISLTLPQIFALTVVGAVILLGILYLIGITDKNFLVKMFAIAIVLLTLDYLYVKTYG